MLRGLAQSSEDPGFLASALFFGSHHGVSEAEPRVCSTRKRREVSTSKKKKNVSRFLEKIDATRGVGKGIYTPCDCNSNYCIGTHGSRRRHRGRGVRQEHSGSRRCDLRASGIGTNGATGTGTVVSAGRCSLCASGTALGGCDVHGPLRVVDRGAPRQAPWLENARIHAVRAHLELLRAADRERGALRSQRPVDPGPRRGRRKAVGLDRGRDLRVA